MDSGGIWTEEVGDFRDCGESIKRFEGIVRVLGLLGTVGLGLEGAGIEAS